MANEPPTTHDEPLALLANLPEVQTLYAAIAVINLQFVFRRKRQNWFGQDPNFSLTARSKPLRTPSADAIRRAA
jgi:hypothetical protein